MKAENIMTRRVITVDPDRPVVEVAKLMLERNISGVPVVDADNRILGIVSEGDLIRRQEAGTDAPKHAWWLRIFDDSVAGARDYLKTHGTKASDIMTTDVVTISEDTPLAEIAHLMERHHVKRLPVTKDGKLVGLVSRANIVRRIAAAREMHIETYADDEGIRRQVEAALDEQPWASVGTTSITVNDGMVEFWGTISSDAERDATRVVAQEVSGIKKIVDHRQVRPYVPMTGL